MYYFGVKVNDSELIICDALRRRIVKLSNVDATNLSSDRLLSSKELYDIAHEFLPYLCEPMRFDEAMKRQESIYRSKVANITVAFSEKCNLACKYCYEQSNGLGKGVVDIKQLCRFIVNYMNTNLLDHLHIELYGGEPVLQKNEIRSLCNLLRTAKIDYSLSMMTNGTIYDELFFSELITAGLQKVEISIDGPEAIHNFQRPMKGNGNCYETVISNIKKLYKIVPVVIRVNVGRNNIDYIPDLLSSLVAHGINNHCYIYFTPIINSPLSFRDKEEYSKVGQCYIDARSRGFNAPMRIYATGPCYLLKNHSFAVLPDNTIRKCIAITETEIGNTCDGILSVLNYEGRTRACENCDFYPICFGGCQFANTSCHQCPRELFEGLLPNFLLSKAL